MSLGHSADGIESRCGLPSGLGGQGWFRVGPLRPSDLTVLLAYSFCRFMHCMPFRLIAPESSKRPVLGLHRVKW